MNLKTATRVGGVDPMHLQRSVQGLFAPPSGPPRIGVEVEALPVDADTGRPIPPAPAVPGERAVLPALETWAVAHGWTPGRTYAGSLAFHRPGGGTVSFEPGGQIEYATAPTGSLDALEADVVSVLPSLALALRSEGIELLARGVDPITPLGEARLHVSGERYRRMSTHYARRGPWGRRMMRQTAALHVNVDPPGPAFEGWRVANAVTPALIALFANSPRVEGADTGHRSSRAGQWRNLDPSRTGTFDGGGDPVARYLDFALRADAFLLGPEDAVARPFRDWVSQATPTDWSTHLSTLFPEVRPRGYLEVRSIDALPLSLVVIPAAVLAGLLFDDETCAQAAVELAPASFDALERAGRKGLGDPGIAATALHTLELAMRGLRRLGPAVASEALLSRVDEFRAAYPARGLDPGHRPDDRLVDGLGSATGGEV